jgi:3-hydroxyacyl-CoA dehydrogenase
VKDSSSVRAIDRDDVRVLEIFNPPVNAMAQPVRAALLGAIRAADRDPTVRALVIVGSGANFIAGADIREFDAAPLAPILADVLRELELCPKPVIAAVHGSALGGGMELALACHYRCAHEQAQFGLPEVKLGLLPGAGGTVRLPRLAGVEVALSLILSGEAVGCSKAAELGVVDQVVHGRGDTASMSAAGVRYAQQLIRAAAGPRRVRDLLIDVAKLPPQYFAEQLSVAEEQARNHGPEAAIVRSIEAAARLPFDEALAIARREFEQRRVSDSSRALRHLFFAERGGKVLGEPRDVRRVGVVGSGTMGSGIAVCLALAGYHVTLIDSNVTALAAGIQRLKDTIGGSAHKGRISTAQSDEAIARVSSSADFSALSDAQMVIEAVFENMSVKREVFAALDAICPDGAVLASNTSTLDVDALASATRRTRDVLGMHFFSPANILRLVEVVRGRQTSTATLATTLSVIKRMGKLGIVVGNCFGFVGNRMLYAYGRENQSMLLEGATPMQIDAAYKRFGMAMGPNAVGDLAGLDVGYRARRERKDLAPDPRYYRVADLLVEAGRLGQKTGHGMFLYKPGSREPQVDPEVEKLISDEAARLAIQRRTFTDDEIVERGMLALVNEGARILDEGIADSAADIDAIWCNGYGYPRWRGGPMFYGEMLGLAHVVERIHAIAAQPGFDYWQVAPLLERLASSRQSLAAAAASVSKPA